MNFSHVLKESLLRVFKSPMKCVALAFIIIVAGLFGLLTLYAFNLMPDSMQDFPIAIVNEDKGTTADGENVNYGADIIDMIEDNDSVKWEVCHPGYFDQGINETKYFAAFVIPEDFSEKAMSAKNGVAEKAQITYLGNIRKSYIFSQFGKNIKSQFMDIISQSISGSYVEGTFDSLYDINDQLTEAASGSRELNDGANQLVTGAGQLQTASGKLTAGISKLKTSTGSLEKGASKLDKGASDLREGTAKLEKNMSTLKKGASTLNKGTSTLQKNTAKLTEGTAKLAKGTEDLASGAAQLNTAVQDIEVSTIQLTDAQKKQISDGAAEAKEVSGAASQLSSGIGSAVSSSITGTLKSNAVKSAMTTQILKDSNVQAAVALLESQGYPKAQELIYGIVSSTLEGASSQISADTIASSISPSVSTTLSQVAGASALGGAETVANVANEKISESAKALTNLKTATAQLSDGADELNAKTSTLNTGAAQLSTGTSQLTDGAAKLNTGASQLKTGASQLKTGASQLKTGTSQLSTGADKLNTGALQLKIGVSPLPAGISQLADGTVRLDEGSAQLADGLADGADKVDEGLTNSSSDMAEFISAPLEDEDVIYGELTKYSQGFAPLFMSLGLWVGSLILFFVISVRPKEDRLATAPQTVFSGLITAGIFGLLEAIVICTGAVLIHLDPQHLLWLYLFMGLVALTFVSIMYMLNVTFGLAGKLIAVMFTVFQIPSCAGSFPVQLMPEIFNKLNPFLPMTYAIDGIREAFSGSEMSGMLHNSLMLCIFMVIAIVISLFSCKRTAEKTERLEALIQA